MDYDRLTTATQSLERLKVTAQGKQAMYIDNAALARPWRDIANRNKIEEMREVKRVISFFTFVIDSM